MYVSINSNPASAPSAPSKVYSHFPSSLRHGSCPVSCHATWSWKLPRTFPMWGVTTHVSAPNNKTDWTTTLKKNPDTCGLAPSLLRIFDIICQTVRSFARFCTTVFQSSSASDSTLPRYLKEVTIFRRIPSAINFLKFTALASSATNRRRLIDFLM